MEAAKKCAETIKKQSGSSRRKRAVRSKREMADIVIKRVEFLTLYFTLSEQLMILGKW